jgi:uncharacterized protein (TIGR03067 family)
LSANFVSVLLLLAQAAARPAAPPAPGEPLFEIRAEVAAGAPGARPWVLAGPAAVPETVYLGGEVLLDARGVAGAEVAPDAVGRKQIRVHLTPEGASRLAEASRRVVGKRLGIIAGGKLRAVPVVRTEFHTSILPVQGGFTDEEAAAIAARLGPPPGEGSAGAALVEPRRPGTPVPELQGRWRVVEATLNGKVVPDRKLTASTWVFQGGELVLTTGEGETESLAVHPDSPGVIRLEGKSAKGWMLWKREGADLILAFEDNMNGKPDGFGPGALPEKKIVARLRPADSK